MYSFEVSACLVSTIVVGTSSTDVIVWPSETRVTVRSTVEIIVEYPVIVGLREVVNDGLE